MANKKLTKDCEEKIFNNDDITLLRARLTKALKLRVDIKSVALLIGGKDIDKTDEPKITFKNLFKLHALDPDFIYPICTKSFHFC